MSDVELIYDALYAEMVTTPAPEPFVDLGPWPASVFAALAPDADLSVTLDLCAKLLVANG